MTPEGGASPGEAIGRLGMEALERYRQSGDAVDLDIVIDLFEQVYVVDPDGDHPLVWWWSLICAYRERGRFEDLDEAVDMAKQVIARGGPDHPIHDEAVAMLADLGVALVDAGHLDAGIDALEPALTGLPAAFDRRFRGALSCALATAYDRRWQEAGAAADLDAAIAGWDAAEADGWTGPETAMARGSLRWARADSRDDADDARLAVALLSGAAAATTDPAARHASYLAAAAASRVLWEITGELEPLERAAGFADRALAAGPSGPELLEARFERLMAEHFLTDNGRRRGSLLEESVAAAHQAVRNAHDVPADHRAVFALMTALVSFGTLAGGGSVDRTRELVAVAATAKDVWPGYWPHLDIARATLELIDELLNPRPGQGRALASLARAASAPDLPGDLAARIHAMVRMATRLRADLTGNRAYTGTARRLADAAPLWSRQETGRRIRGAGIVPYDKDLVFVLSTLDHIDAGDDDGLRADLADAATGLGSEADPGLVAYLQALRAIIDPADGPLLSLTEAVAPEAVVPTGVAVTIQAMARGDTATARLATERVERHAAGLPAGERRRTALAFGAAGTLRLALAERDGHEPDVDLARAHHRRAIDLLGGPHASGWSRITMNGARAERLGTAPDRRRSRNLGMAALRGHAWQVLAQSGTDDAVAAARTAAADARELAGWCLADRHADPTALDQLIAALDAGRALVLRASSASRAVPELLRGRGAAGLATEWEATAGRGRDMVVIRSGTGPVEVPDELRLQVLGALGEQAVADFEPITAAEISAALSRLGRDALVYLVEGAAVIVAASGAVTVLDLPTGAVPPARTVPSTGSRDLHGPAGHTADDLDRQCAWAWDAVTAPVLRALPGGKPSIVLVPTGALARVPWHAAYTEESGRRRYAIERAVFSYAPSARSLCAVAGDPPAAVASALIVGNPTGDLPHAGDEAATIHRAFYPAGTYLGPGGGTPQAVLEWIGKRPAGAAMLHFACHGTADPDHPADAALVLAGGRLDVRTLLDRSRSAALRVDQVFLAACASGAAGPDDDEALSLTTSFLAAGARTVFGALWPIPDAETSLLMIMVHHYLRREGCTPAEALNRAQLGMADPGARPVDLPLDRRADAAGLASWAGFVHTGR
ncbi:CHAT domain-containing protein [Nucisporomicrobium flavum]|uniref:CHAT domain-containing protein n=1 Tax=Nucisporomicrobium flavum TaxID=2785915 RepID=UPI0018F55DB3|nr:CHAT domain-containing protein [Nucisporomicrobium flavum]